MVRGNNVSMLMDARHHVAFLLHDISRQIRYRFDARARSLGVTRPQWRALMYIAREQGCTQSELAEFLEVERITLCRMIDRLAEGGMVERRADPQDRRVWRLHLTGRANEIVESLAEIGAKVELETLSHLEPAEQGLLHDFLLRMRDGLGGRAGGDKA